MFSFNIKVHVLAPRKKKVIPVSVGSDKTAVFVVRRAAVMNNVPYTTTLAGARAAAEGIAALLRSGLDVSALQDYHVSY